MTVLAAFATAPACSIVTGKRLDPRRFIGGFDRRNLGAVFSREELRTAVKPAPVTDKMVCNIVLLGNDERRTHGRPCDVRNAIVRLGKTVKGRQSLMTQCIDKRCLEALQADDCAMFLDARAAVIVATARSLSGA